jgi:hypothetical protein
MMWGVMLTGSAYCHFSLKLPNLLTVPLMLGGLALGAVHDGGGHPDGGVGGVLASAACVGLAFLTFLPSYARRRFPAGGVKFQMGFAACIGAFYGLQRGLPIVFLAGFLSAAMLAILLKAKTDEILPFDPNASGQMPVGFLMTCVAFGSALSLNLLAF